MKDVRSARRLVKIWHRREKATIDHLVSTAGDLKGRSSGRILPAVTSTGLVVEEQVRKAWHPCGVGLPIF